MTIPTYPSIPYDPLVDSWSETDMYLDPLETDMEGGNKRLRTRPGDETRRVSFSLLFSAADYITFRTFVITTLNRGTSRFTMNVWNGTSFDSKTVQFAKKPVPTPAPPKIRVALDLWVFS